MDIRDLKREVLEAVLLEKGYPRYRGQQVVQWLYGSKRALAVSSWTEMKNLPADLREGLAQSYTLYTPEIVSISGDPDQTQKFLLKLSDGETVETVLIPETVKEGFSGPRDWRHTLCLSSQVGCAMGCRFCHTATMGLKRNMTQAEILGQVLAVKGQLARTNSTVEIRNLVFMGMGEPLHNLENVMGAISWLTAPDGLDFSSKRITVSTSGLLPEIQRLLDETKVRLAISLNASDEKTRADIMPVTKKYSLHDILALCRDLSLPRKDRITFEYVLLSQVNDRDQDARRLIRLLHGIRAKINLIAFNEFPGSVFKRPEAERVQEFRQKLSGHGIQVNVRQSRGRSVLAACGQLRSARESIKESPTYETRA